MSAPRPGAETRRVDGLAVYERPPRPDRGPRVVFVHGAMDRGASFLRLTRLLPEIEAVRYDRRGYGRSVDAGPAPTLQAQVDDLLAVAGPGPVVVVGHSLGGVLALAAATSSPHRVAGAVVYEAPAPWEPWWPGHGAGPAAEHPDDVAEGFMRRVVGDDVWERLPPSTQEARRREGPALVAELTWLRSLPGPPYDPSVLGGRVVVGWGAATLDRHHRASTALAERLGAPGHAVAGAGHGGHASHPDALAAMVREVLALPAVATTLGVASGR